MLSNSGTSPRGPGASLLQSLDLLHLNHLLQPLHTTHQNHLLFFLSSLPLQSQSLYLPLLAEIPLSHLSHHLQSLVHLLQPSGNTENPLQLSPQMMMTLLLKPLPQRRMMRARKRKRKTLLIPMITPMILLLMTPSTPLPMPTLPPSLNPDLQRVTEVF